MFELSRNVNDIKVGDVLKCETRTNGYKQLRNYGEFKVLEIQYSNMRIIQADGSNICNYDIYEMFDRYYVYKKVVSGFCKSLNNL